MQGVSKALPKCQGPNVVATASETCIPDADQTSEGKTQTRQSMGR